MRESWPKKEILTEVTLRLYVSGTASTIVIDVKVAFVSARCVNYLTLTSKTNIVLFALQREKYQITHTLNQAIHWDLVKNTFMTVSVSGL